MLTFPVEKTGSVGKGRGVDNPYFMSQRGSLPSLSPASEWHRRVGNGGYSQTITVCLCHFFLLHVYSSLSYSQAEDGKSIWVDMNSEGSEDVGKNQGNRYMH